MAFIFIGIEIPEVESPSYVSMALDLGSSKSEGCDRAKF